MGLCPPALYEHVVHIDFYVSIYLLVEHVTYQPLACSSRILQTEGHGFVIVQTLAGY